MAVWSYISSHAPELGSYVALAIVSSKVFVYVQRLYFHPLSKFPGPKICAASRIYEFYWDSVRQGRLWARLPELHRQYGPIIRIGPDEIHISDSEYFDTLFGFRPLDKDAMTAKQFGMKHAMFGTEDYKQYTNKRAAFGDAFSRSKALKLQDMINEHLDKACDLMRERSRKGETVDLAFICRATPAEIITEWMFGEQYGFLKDEVKTKNLYDKSFDTVMGMTNLGRFIPFWIPMLHVLLVQQIRKALGLTYGGAMMDYFFTAQEFMKKVIERHGDPGYASSASSFFDNFLDSPQPAAEKQGNAMTEQAMAIWTGGWDTVGFSSTLGFYSVLRRPAVLERLCGELRQIWPDTNQRPSMAALDGAPYLNAVIKEAFRHSAGALTRLKRVNRHGPERYGEWVMPAGTCISMSLPEVHHDPKVWGADHAAFRPERWLGSDDDDAAAARLDKYLVTFSKGTRVCPGIELTWIEFRLLFATFFRKFDMRIDEASGVSDDDILPYFDGFTSVTKTFKTTLPVYATPVSD